MHVASVETEKSPRADRFGKVGVRSKIYKVGR